MAGTGSPCNAPSAWLEMAVRLPPSPSGDDSVRVRNLVFQCRPGAPRAAASVSADASSFVPADLAVASPADHPQPGDGAVDDGRPDRRRRLPGRHLGVGRGRRPDAHPVLHAGQLRRRDCPHQEHVLGMGCPFRRHRRLAGRHQLLRLPGRRHLERHRPSDLAGLRPCRGGRRHRRFGVDLAHFARESKKPQAPTREQVARTERKPRIPWTG